MKFFLYIAVFGLLAIGASADVEPFCTDSDGGDDIWTPGMATSDQGVLVDDCDGSSDNLKEATCNDQQNTHPENIKCSDYGAVCVTAADAPDYCACPEGTHFNESTQFCDETPIFCGDGIKNGDEQCDGTDGITEGFVCIKCFVEPIDLCGDGNLDSGEACDDGNSNDADACSNDCTVNEVVVPVCGNGQVESGETCDDSNTADNDGCSANCQIEVSVPVCGDSVTEAPETCDDGNTASGDGCSPNCTIEEVNPPVCGNSVLESDEQCDDGNTADLDGCSSICELEEEQEIPEFGTIAAGLATAGAGASLLLLRKRK